MWLLDKMLSRLVRKGRLIVTDYDGREYAYGPGGDVGFGEAIHIRFTDKGAALHVGRYPQVGAGEAYMDGRLVIEASGGITLDTIAEFAATGVDYASSGALTHSAPALDVGLDIEI